MLVAVRVYTCDTSYVRHPCQGFAEIYRYRPSGPPDVADSMFIVNSSSTSVA